MFYMEGGDIYITRGDTATFKVGASFVYPEGYDETEQEAVIMPKMSVKKALDDTDYALQTEAEMGSKDAYISLNADDTDIEPGSYYYDIQIEYETGGKHNVYTIGPYRFIVLNDVTR